MNKTKLIKIWGISITIIALLAFSGAALSLYFYNTGEWVCIATQCTEWVSGDEWVARYCRPIEDKTDMLCKFDINDNHYELPLSKIDATQFKSCIAEQCAASVYVKPTLEVE